MFSIVPSNREIGKAYGQKSGGIRCKRKKPTLFLLASTLLRHEPHAVYIVFSIQTCLSMLLIASHHFYIILFLVHSRLRLIIYFTFNRFFFVLVCIINEFLNWA